MLESRVGGRIYERTAGGRARLGRRDRLGSAEAAGVPVAPGPGPQPATDVDIRFVPRGPGDTRVEIEHRGWERLGGTADVWRDRNRIGWQTLLPHFAAAITTGDR